MLTGDARAGRRYFEAACTSCHSAAGDLAGIASRIEGLALLRRMLYPGGQAGGGRRPTATVTTSDGATIAGEVASRDEFTIAVVDAGGRYRSWPTARVRFTIDDPLEAHVAQLARYTDDDDARRTRLPTHPSLGRLHDFDIGAELAIDTSVRGCAHAHGARGRGLRPDRHLDTELDSASLLRTPKDSWPTYHGDYSGRRHSALTQITQDNVSTLGLAWAFQTNADAAGQVDADPRRRHRVLDGTRQPLGDRCAVGKTDLALSRIPRTMGSTSATAASAVHRPLGLPHDTRRASVAFDRVHGQVLWNVEIADSKRGYWSTNAPLVIRDHVIVGVSGDFDNLPGLLRVVRPRDRRSAVDVLQHAARRHAGSLARRRDRRADVDDGHLRSRARPAVRRHRQPDARLNGAVAARRQQVDMQHRRARPRHRQARVGLSGVAARHARLGRGRGARARRREVRRAPTASSCFRPRATATTSCSTASTARTC